jgi:hypothetical protein
MADSSRATVRVLDLGEGLNYDTSPANLSPGSTLSSDNWVMREGGITPRPGQIKLGNNPQLGVPITGGNDIVTSEGIHFQLVSGTTLMAYLDSGTSWSNLSWIPGFSGGRAPNPATTRWWVNQSVRSDGSVIAFMAPTTPDSNASGGAVSCWLPGAPTWSTLTGNVPAKAVVSFSNYLILWSTGTFPNAGGGSTATYIPYPTRVQWSDRGNCLDIIPTSVNLAGYEDLLDARGQGTGAAVVENKVILFTEDETWQGVELGVPGFAQFQFTPLDRSVGCRRPFTIQTTPDGVMFVGQDNYIYLIPKTGGPPVLVSKQIAQLLRNNDSSWAVYNVPEHRYELYSTVLSTMSAEVESVSATTTGYTTAELRWENLRMSGSESLEVWLTMDSLAGWSGPVVTVPYNGFLVQTALISGLTSGTSYQVGIRAVRDGVYTSGYSTPSPNNWVPPIGHPFSVVFSTRAAIPVLDLAPPTNFAQQSCTDFMVGPKNYTTKVLGWTASTSTYVVGYQVYKSAGTSIFDPVTASLYQSGATTQFSVDQLCPPNQPLTRNAYAVRGYTLDEGLGVFYTAFSGAVSITNQVCA